ncbi:MULTISPECIES: TonB-dependent receptor plug domain-containing protein [Acinetobacter]|uniref:TonB-dependent receptor plug domain-containing protein n=1 Tax=Acinetobacter TaxID=469 RepID=UPI0004D9C708|nr:MULTISPECIES: TonB-dependent receptor [unclassified Acinetobacter]KEC83252.1 TonB-dependent receptor [Acinetobacter sp. ETR1]UOH16620.1 TonB-dependent receptor [Acinetobacter sp. NyZ410]WEE41571.1 TonB-dependent receptor [Acinetobacter sp. TAC-1]
MHRTKLYWGTLSTLSLAIFAITSASLANDETISANKTTEATQLKENESPKQLKTLVFAAEQTPAKDPDISAVAKTIVTREEMLQFGDQSVNDALRRAAGFQMPTPGQGPRGSSGSGSMRFRGGGAPVFLINGEAVQGGPRGGMSIVDSITPEMIERIEITKQPSVAQASVASSAVINIILKEPLDDARISGNVKLGYGITQSDQKEEQRKNISVQADGRDGAWIYSVSANQMWNDSKSSTEIENINGTRQQIRTTNRTNTMFSPRVEYQIDDQQKLVSEIFYRKNESDGSSSNQVQNDKNDSIRLNTRYERKDKGDSDKVRLSIEKQNETESTRSNQYSSYIDETVNEYGLAYDGVRKFDESKQVKFGLDARANALASNIADTLDEQRYALYLEGSWKFSKRQTLTVGARQEWLERSGLVEYSDQNLSPVLAHRLDFNDQWSLQTNVSRAFKSPNSNNLMPTVSISTDADAGSINNPDRGGNPNLRPEKITALETTLGYNTTAGGVNITAFHRDIDDYIEKVIRQEGTRFVERPYNQDQATTYGVEISGRYALKQTENGHSFMLNGQLSTVRAKIEDTDHNTRLASDVAPYTASTGVSYNYQPWQLASSINLSYTPEFTRALDNLPYDRTTNQRVNVDISATKRFPKGWATTLSARNILSTDYKERLNNQSDGALYEARVNDAIPSFLFSVEKKF